MYPACIKRLWPCLLPLLLLAGCAGLPGAADDKAATPAKAAEDRLQREFRQAIVLMQEKDMQGAAEKFHDLIERYPQMTGAWANLGLIHLKARQWDKARNALQQALQLNPRHAPAWNYLGVVERNQGRFKQAEQAYIKAIDADAGYAPAWLNLGILYDIYLDRPAQALSRYQRYQKLTGDKDKKVAKWIIELRRRVPKQSQLSTEARHG